MLHLTDLDELIQNVRSSYVKEYITEALTAYRAGAYRAAVSTTWVAVCIDIIEKIRELSISGDTQAEAIERRLNGILPTDTTAMLRFESELLDIASTQLEFISLPEALQLGRLKDDRNFCVHPTFQKDGKHLNVTPENARNHIVNACKFLFILPPTKGKVIIETLVNLASQNSFPEDEEKAFHILSSDNYLGRVKETVIRSFFICLLKKLLRDEPPPTDINSVNRVCSAISAVHRISSASIQSVANEQLPRLLINISDQRIRILFPIMNKCAFIKTGIDNPIKLRLGEIVRTMPIEQIAELGVPSAADDNEQIKTSLLERYNGLDWTGQLVMLKGTQSNSLKDKAIKMFCEAGSFSSAYDYGKNILLTHMPFFNRSDILQVFEGTISNRYDQIVYANGMYSIFEELYQDSISRALLSKADWESFLNRLPNNCLLYRQLCALVGVAPLPEGTTNA
jgi:hypothetical protein